MIDMEKVKKGVEHCFHGQECCGDIECPYYIEHLSDCCCLEECQENLKTDVIALLKEQEAVKPVRDKETGRIWLCGNCGTYVGFEDNDPNDPNEFDKYCRVCGKPVLWEGR